MTWGYIILLLCCILAIWGVASWQLGKLLKRRAKEQFRHVGNTGTTNDHRDNTGASK